jgi:O-antigen/teichoic acid export membrane protein
MIGPSVIIFLFGPTIFRLIFGNEWQIAGEYAQILKIMYLPKMIVSPLSYLFILVGRQKEDFILHIFVVIISMAFFTGYLMYFDFKSALISYSIIYLFVYLVYYIRSKIFARNGF